MTDFVPDDELAGEFIPAVRSAPSGMTDDDLRPENVVKFGQQMRRRAFNQITNNGTDLSSNLGDVLQILRDQDAAALTTRKLNIDEKAVDNDRQAIESAKQLRKEMGIDPYAVGDDNRDRMPQRTRNPLPDVIPDLGIALKPGEDAQGEQVLSVANYIREEE